MNPPRTDQNRIERLRAALFDRRPVGRAAVPLDDGARVAVVGGGPAGSFFAITLLREARRAGRDLSVRIYERRAALVGADRPTGFRPPPTCNYCAGGISPRLSDELDRLGLAVPPGVVQSRVRRIVVQSHWKNLEIRVPDDRPLFTVYRGSRPVDREDPFLNFDSFLLSSAAAEGAEIVNAEVTGLSRGRGGRPVVDCLRAGREPEPIEADFLAIATGVNPSPGQAPVRFPLRAAIRRLLPGFAPPGVRRTLIFELEMAPELSASLEGEITFFLYGSSDLRLEMGSLMPKGRFATVVLIGRDIDLARDAGATRAVIDSFLSLPQVQRILPRHLVRTTASCYCRPNMVIGCATSPCGDRVAVIGDMLTSRLYKDGLHSAFLTASGLARSVLYAGVDRRSLERSFWPLIRELNGDQRSGRAVFLAMALTFGRPVLSRVAYQAVLRERRVLPRGQRPLESILWSVASGDDGYRNVLRSMLAPRAIVSFLFRGGVVTLRNRVTEILFGLSWKGLGRYPTGVYQEERDAKVEQLAREGLDGRHFTDFRRMYSIRLRAPAEAIYRELGRLCDPTRDYLHPRFVKIGPGPGEPNEVGSVLRYRVAVRALSIDLRLEVADPGRRLVYRVTRGFARGGFLVLDIVERHPGDCVLSLLVTFDFRTRAGGLRAAVWSLYRHFFPKFVHDVIWNHALCKLKDIVERQPKPGDETQKVRPAGR